MKYFVTMHTGYMGSEGHEVVDFPKGMSDDDIQMECYYMALDNASMYGYDMCDDDCEDDDCEYEHPGNSNIEGHAVPYVPAEHDMYLSGR